MNSGINLNKEELMNKSGEIINYMNKTIVNLQTNPDYPNYQNQINDLASAANNAVKNMQYGSQELYDEISNLSGRLSIIEKSMKPVVTTNLSYDEKFVMDIMKYNNEKSKAILSKNKDSYKNSIDMIDSMYKEKNINMLSNIEKILFYKNKIQLAKTKNEDSVEYINNLDSVLNNLDMNNLSFIELIEVESNNLSKLSKEEKNLKISEIKNKLDNFKPNKTDLEKIFYYDFLRRFSKVMKDNQSEEKCIRDIDQIFGNDIWVLNKSGFADIYPLLSIFFGIGTIIWVAMILIK